MNNHWRLRLLTTIGLFVLYSLIAVFITSRRIPPTGDEPHYLITTHSLALEGDLSLRENYVNRDYKIFYPGLLTKRTTFSPDKTRELPAFGPGLSFFLTPFYKLAIEYSLPLVPFLRVIMCLVASLGLYNLMAFIERFVPGREAYIVVIIAALSSPLLTYSSMFYPEMLAFLAVVIALRCIDSISARPVSAGLALSFISAALLWIHPKYLALSLLIALISGAIFWYPGPEKDSQPDSIQRYVVPLLHFVLTAAGIFSFFWFLHSVYGSWSPNRIYGGAQRELSFFELLTKEGFDRVWVMLRMLPGYFLDQRFGVIVYAPIYAAFFPCVLWCLKTFRARMWPLIILFLSHFLLLSWGAQMGGYAPPSRHFVVIVPLLIVPIAICFTRWTGGQKSLFSFLAAIGLTISVLILTNYRAIFTNATWRNPDGYSEFFQWLHLHNALPRFTSSPPDFYIALAWIVLVALTGYFLYPRSNSATS